MKIRHLFELLVVVLISPVLCNCVTANRNPETITMDNTGSSLAPFCLGRFAIDAPLGSVVSGGNYEYWFARIEDVAMESREQFDDELSSRIQLLKSSKHSTDPNLLRVVVRPDDSTAIIVYWEFSSITAAVNVDGYKWIDGHRFLLRTEAARDRQSDAVDRMAKRLSGLRPRADDDIPAEPGYCFKGGFVANTEWENEKALATIDIAGYPDAVLTVWILPIPKSRSDASLVERMVGVLSKLGSVANGVQILRQGGRTVAGTKGDEYLIAGPNSGGMRAHLFRWETDGEGTLDTPSIEITLETGRRDPKGNPQKTRLSDEEAIRLWDRIVGSFRLRKTAAPGSE